MTDELCELSATELLARYKAKTLSPVEATKAVLARAERVEPKINAFTLIDPERALAQAKESEARWAKGQPKGRLDGVPASIKDLMLTKGWPTLRGSLTVDEAGPWNEDSPAVVRLKENGAVLFGKTTTPEFGWKGVTDSKRSGVTRNPWKLDRTPGGSSGGGTAALAAGVGPLALGSDGGGSIRIPCGFSGVFGIKPNFGRVPAWPPSAMGTLSHHGPMARNVRDAALMLNVLAEPDPRDWQSLPYDGRDWTADLVKGVRGLKVAYSPALGYAKVHPEVAAAVAAAAKAFAELGATVEETDPGFADPTPCFKMHWWVGAAGGFGSMPKEKLALMDVELQQIVSDGQRITAADYHNATSQRFALGQHMRAFHQRYDLLLTPALAVPAFAAGTLAPDGWESEEYWLKWTPFTYPFNLTQQPACSIPCGFSSDGLPIGLQIVADNYREDLVLRAAQAYETARPMDRKPPL
jgi:aspartyl-tRNA(Asn)/glutamyl-tRNA(Gln) amidotransferase subunit A